MGLLSHGWKKPLSETLLPSCIVLFNNVRLGPADVREALRRWEFGSYCADIEAAQGKDTSYYRQLYETVSRICRTCEKKNQNVPEELQKEQTWQGGSTLGRGKYNFYLKKNFFRFYSFFWYEQFYSRPCANDRESSSNFRNVNFTDTLLACALVYISNVFSLQARPTPAHLTSVQAEQILATACENESDNAKRMRLGLEPVSQPMPTLPAATVSNHGYNMCAFTQRPSVIYPYTLIIISWESPTRHNAHEPSLARSRTV